MSFALTTDAARNRTKTVTRRLGWEFLKPGDRVQQVVKGMGLKPGEHPEKIHVIEIVSNDAEPLIAIVGIPCRHQCALERCKRRDECAMRETAREGFPEMTEGDFVRMFIAHMGGAADQIVNRIEFRYVD
jgi:hypothetical protein